ncbi:hypothetical protein BS47DRAFT_1390759 [Hydnum rufescens UP504]|uniref:Uncharacterized protein n=1 Tax=Hydnum rufescens UP504 TaxID=1448309 RepID=A0A9P6DYS8_9AGAM|nr:hypothetical protein BS47DRAFT_1390759 [Hydnum rufescens UP504]
MEAESKNGETDTTYLVLWAPAIFGDAPSPLLRPDPFLWMKLSYLSHNTVPVSPNYSMGIVHGSLYLPFSRIGGAPPYSFNGPYNAIIKIHPLLPRCCAIIWQPQLESKVKVWAILAELVEGDAPSIHCSLSGTKDTRHSPTAKAAGNGKIWLIVV